MKECKKFHFDQFILGDDNHNTNDSTRRPLVCAYSKLRTVKLGDNENSGVDFNDELTYENKTETCSDDHKYCYSLWQQHPSNASLFVILAQGWST